MGFFESLVVVLSTIFSYGLAGIILLNVVFGVMVVVLGITDTIAGTKMLDNFLPA